jgi:hypothetical protein
LIPLIFLAGFPTYIPDSFIFFVTTLPAPITTLSQIDTGSIVAFEPIETKVKYHRYGK